MPRGVYSRTTKTPKAATHKRRQRIRSAAAGIIPEIQTINRSQLVRSSVHRDTTVEVPRGTTIVIKII